jgi:integrase
MRHTNSNRRAIAVQSEDGFVNDQAKAIDSLRLAIRELDRRLTLINNEEYRPARHVTFAEFAGKWMKEIMIHHKPSTRSSEKSIINVQLVPFFGRYELRHINLEMIQQFVNKSEKSPKTVKNSISVLMVMWDMASAWGYAQHNPFPRNASGRLLLKLPTVVKGKGYNFTVEESQAIIERAKGRWKTFFRILAFTGMRPGELAGLRTSDVGLRTLRIAQSVWQQKVQTPKTANAVRTFAISASLAEEISVLIAESKPNDYGLLFVTDPGRKRNTRGEPLSMDNFRNRVLNPILEELGIRAKVEALGVRCGNYAFRHMNITELSRLGVPLKTIQKRVGHATGSDVTMEHYIHAVDADDLAAADALGALLSPKRTQPVESQ